MDEINNGETSDLVSKETLKSLALNWGSQTFHMRSDELIKLICNILDTQSQYPFWTLQAHSARTPQDQAKIDQLGGILGAIEPRLYYGIEAAEVLQIALGLINPSSKYITEPGSRRNNFYLSPFMKKTTIHDELCKPIGNLVTNPDEIVRVLGAEHQLMREDRAQFEPPTQTAGRLKQLSNQWRIAVL